jgi:NAD+ diphosphatase
MFVPGLIPDNYANPCFLVFSGDELLLKSPQDALFSADELFGIETLRHHYIGTLNQQACYAVEINDNDKPRGHWTGLRPIVADETLFSAAARGLQILHWDRDHQFCGRCAKSLVPLSEQLAKHCPSCELTAYPRISPAVIVRVTHGKQILLSRAPHFRPGMYSVQAGFVEAGEALEHAVERELYEELKIRVSDVRYFGSQSWPFPHSLMVGFTATHVDGELQPDPDEVDAAAWFERGNLPELPPLGSIARALVDDWRQSIKMP